MSDEVRAAADIEEKLPVKKDDLLYLTECAITALLFGNTDLLKKVFFIIARMPNSLNSIAEAISHPDVDPMDAAFKAIVQELLTVGLLEEADAIQRERLDRDPANFWEHYEFTQLALQSRRHAEAIQRAMAVRDRFPAHAVAWLALGQACYGQGDFEAAARIYDSAHKQFPDDYWVEYFFCTAADLRGDHREAARRWQSVVDRFPQEPRLHVELSRVLAKIDTEWARQAVELAARRFPDNTEITRSQLEFLIALSDFDLLGHATQFSATARTLLPCVGPPLVGVVLSEHPLVIFSACYSWLSVIEPVMGYYGRTGETVYFFFNSIMSIAWHEKQREQLVSEYAQIRIKHPKADITFLVNDAHELDAARKCELPAAIVNHNAFVDENLFTIDPLQPKQFTAVYNARFHPYKRHHLATDIDNICLIMAEPTSEHIKSAREMFESVTINRYNLGPLEVVRLLNQSHCGLCLSSAEGAMFASMEYLLCGLPVVSTQNIGGRDWFLSTDYAIICESDAKSVRRAVEEIIAREIRPDLIRLSTIERVRRERLVFIDLVEQKFAASGQPSRRYQEEFQWRFSDKFQYKSRPLGSFFVRDFSKS